MIKRVNILLMMMVFCLSLLCSCKKNSNEVTSISVNKNSVLKFNENEFDMSKIKIDIYYSNGDKEEKELTSTMITSNIDNINEVGTHKIDVLYEEKTCQFNIEIIAKLVVSSIAISNTSITTFEKGQIDVEKISLDVTYTNGTTKKEILKTSDIVTNINELNETGTHQLEILYYGFTLTIQIEVISSSLDFNYEKVNGGYAITGYSGNDEIVVIPSTYKDLPIIEIARQAFFKNNSIIKVVIPSTVKVIREAAFYKMSNLKTVVVPKSVTLIEKYGLTSAKIIYLESEEIKASFGQDWCDTLHTSIQLGVDLDTIVKDGDYEYFVKNEKLVLSNYYGNDTIVITPSSYQNKNVEIIGAACFRGNTNILNLTISEKVVTIEKYALAECENLTELHLASTIEILGEYSLRGCTALEHLILPTSLKVIDYGAFNMCSNLKEMIIPEHTTYIGGYAFAWCVKLTKIYIPSSVTEVKAGACYSCSSATIYCEVEAEPSSWETGWNMSNRKVIWSYTEE